MFISHAISNDADMRVASRPSRRRYFRVICSLPLILTHSAGARSFRPWVSAGWCAMARISPVPIGIVEALKDREDADGFIKLDCRPRFHIGDKIRVLDGAFSSCLGLFEGMAERERVAILLDLLGRKVRVILDADLVAAA